MTTALPTSRTRRLAGPTLAVGAIVEIVVAASVAHATSWGLTILLLVLLSIVGATLLPRQALAGIRTVRRATREGRRPDAALADTALGVVGSILLAVPGFVTAAIGLLCLAPVTRPLLRRLLSPWLARRVVTHARPTAPRPTTQHDAPTVIEGEVVDERPVRRPGRP